MTRVVAALTLLILAASSHAATVIMVTDSFPGSSPTLRAKLRDALASAGFRVEEIAGTRLAARLETERESGCILLLPDSRHFPADAKPALDAFLKRRNHLMAISEPVLGSVIPAQKTYHALAAQAEIASSGEKLPAGIGVVCAIPQSKGFASGALGKSRYVPVVRIRDQMGKPRGSVANLYLNTANEYAGSVWGFVGYDQRFLERNAGRLVPVIVSMLDRMRTGVFLANAGTEFFGYTEGEATRTGGYVVNLTREPVEARIDFVIVAEGGFHQTSSAEAVIQPLPLADADNLLKPIEGWPVKLPAGEYLIRATLSLNGKAVDEIAHLFWVAKYPPLTGENTVTLREGRFMLNGKPWYTLGVNYRPGDFRANWLSPDQYDPDIIEQDLALAQEGGVNVLSIQYHKLEQARPLVDFLARCDRRGIKAHIYLPGLDPLQPDFGLVDALIREAHLSEDPAVLAY